MSASSAIARFSRQIRAIHPEHVERPHPKTVQMAHAVCHVMARGDGVSFSDLRAAGFSVEEILEHRTSAERILGKPGVRH